MNKIKISALLIAFVTCGVYAQQVTIEDQYLNNAFIANPALTGMENYLDVRASYKNQWTGIEGSPETYYLSLHTPLGKVNSTNESSGSLPLRISRPERLAPPSGSFGRGAYERGSKVRHGLGGYVVADLYGPFRTTLVFGNYAAHIPVGNETYLSFGVGAGLNSINFDQSKAILGDNVNDATYDRYVEAGGANNYFNANGGIALYNRRFYMGYAASRVLESRVAIGEEPRNADIFMVHNLYMSHEFLLSDNLSLIPSFRVHYDEYSPLNGDVSTKLMFADKFIMGVTYRHDYALIGLLGFNIENLFKVGYAYDFAISELKGNNSGSHELVLSIPISKNNARQQFFW